MSTSRLLASLALLLAPVAARAQSSAPADAASERAAVLAAVTSLFDGMRAGDSAKVRAAFHPNAQFVTALVRNGQPTVVVDTLDKFLQAVGTPHAEVWDERLRDTVVHVDGPLAVVWSGYAFYRGATFSHCGVDAFQLARTPAGWRIISIADTRQRTGCPEQGGATR